jgi:hypothetical protein
MDMTWKDINVFQWQQLADLQNNTEGITPDELSIKTIAIITNLTEQQIREMDDKKLFKIAGKTKFLEKKFDVKHEKYIHTKGKRYRCVYDVKKMPTARYVESKHFASNFNDNIHRIAASMVIPQKRNWYGKWIDEPFDASKHEDYANDILTASITEVLGSVVFFCQVYRNWIKVSKDYLIWQMMMTAKMSRLQAEILYQGLCSVLDGFIKPPLLQNMKKSDLNKSMK